MQESKKVLEVSTPYVIINDETISTYDTIRLLDGGYLKIIPSNKFKSLTLNQLVNDKTEDQNNKYEILFSGADGENAPSGSGKDGEDAADCVDFELTVKDLVNDVNVYIKGGNGGNGGDGISGEKEGGNGGDGGNGSNGPNVLFKYGNSRKTIESRMSGMPRLYKNEGGAGGLGGMGGTCTDPYGRGATSDSLATKGGKYGDGGNLGKNGEPGTLNWQNTNPRGLIASGFLDLSDDDNYNIFLESFGGEETLKKYPKLWANLQNTRTNKKTYASDNDDIYIIDNTEASLVTYGEETSNSDLQKSNTDFKNFRVECGVDLFTCKPTDTTKERSQKRKNMPNEAIINVEIYELVGVQKNIIYSSPKFETFDSGLISNIIYSDAYPSSQLEDKEWFVDLTIAYSYETNVKLYQSTFVINQGKSLTSFFNRASLEDPKYKSPTKNTEYIRFLYGREISQNDEYKGDSDYYGGYYAKLVRDDGEKKTIPSTIVPIKGTIYFNSIPNKKIRDIKIDEFLDKNNSGVHRPYLLYMTGKDETTLVQMGGENSDYQTNFKAILENAGSFDINVDPADDNFTRIDFDLKFKKKDGSWTEHGPYDSQAEIKDATFFNPEDHPYENKCYLRSILSFTISYSTDPNDQKGNNSTTMSLEMSSSDAPPLGHEFNFETKKGEQKIYLPPLMICWGCYAADTLIMTADGEKKACDIKKGDKIPVYSGKILTVYEVFTGNDKYICNIRTTDGKSLRVSDSHAMKVYSEEYPDGKKISAARLKKGDMLMAPGGILKIESVKTEAYNDKVYNFEFEEEKISNYIMANGFWSGDIAAQNEPDFREIPAESKALHNEIKALVAEINQKFKSPQEALT